MKKSLYVGCSIVFPFIMVLWCINKISRWVTYPIVLELGQYLPLHARWAALLVHCVVAFVVLGSILLVGWVAHVLWIAKWFCSMERRIFSIPFIRTIYRPMRAAFSVLLDVDTPPFESIAGVPFVYPRSTILTLRLKDRDFSVLRIMREASQQPLQSFFLMTVPNPLMGMVLFADPSKVKETDLSIEDGVVFSMSCGLTNAGKGE